MHLLLVAFGVAALAGTVSAQRIGPLPPLTEQVEVHVVNVDVSVTDAAGNPVLGLTKNDFQIFEDGKPEKITNFAVIRNGGRGGSTPSATAQSAPELRRILLIIDNNYLGMIDRNRALDTIEKYLDSSMSGQWAVATIGHGTDILQSFTADKALIHAALAKARGMPSLDAQHSIDRTPLSERWDRRNDVVTAMDDSAKVAFMSREQTYRSLMAVQNTARAVVDTARSYAAESGKKFIILLTGGMELNTTYTAFEKQQDYELKQLQYEIGQVSDAMVKEANAANFTIQVINARARGMAAPQHDVVNRSSGMVSANLSHDPGNEPIDVSDVDSIPLSIALGTGGMYLPSNDVRASIKRIDVQTSNFYSLGYSPDHNGDRQYHTIQVHVDRRGVRVANRAGYYDETSEDRLEAMLHVRFNFDPGFSSFPVRLKIGPAEPGDRDFVIPVTAAMPLSRITVVPENEGYVGRVHVYCSVFDQNGRNVGFSDKTQEVSMTSAELSGGGDFRYTINVHLHKGAYTIAITLRDELSNEVGSVSEAVHL